MTKTSCFGVACANCDCMARPVDRERAAFEAHIKAELKSSWLYNHAHGHELVDGMVRVIAAEYNGVPQKRAGEYVGESVETMWRGWIARSGVPGYEKMRGGKPVAFWRDDALEAAAKIVEAYQADPWIARDIRAMKSRTDATGVSVSDGEAVSPADPAGGNHG